MTPSTELLGYPVRELLYRARTSVRVEGSAFLICDVAGYEHLRRESGLLPTRHNRFRTPLTPFPLTAEFAH